MNLGAPAKLSKGFIALLARLCSSTACKHQHGGLEGRVQQQQQPQAAPPPASRQPFPLPEDVLLHVLGFQSLNERCEEGSSSPPPTGLPLAAAALRRHLSARNLVAKTSPASNSPTAASAAPQAPLSSPGLQALAAGSGGARAGISRDAVDFAGDKVSAVLLPALGS